MGSLAVAGASAAPSKGAVNAVFPDIMATPAANPSTVTTGTLLPSAAAADAAGARLLAPRPYAVKVAARAPGRAWLWRELSFASWLHSLLRPTGCPSEGNAGSVVVGECVQQIAAGHEPLPVDDDQFQQADLAVALRFWLQAVGCLRAQAAQRS